MRSERIFRGNGTVDQCYYSKQLHHQPTHYTLPRMFLACCSNVWKSSTNFPWTENFSPANWKRVKTETQSDNLCIYYARRPICVFAFIALDWVFISMDVGSLRGWQKGRKSVVTMCQCLSNREGRNVSKFNLCLSCYEQENAFSMGN